MTKKKITLNVVHELLLQLNTHVQKMDSTLSAAAVRLVSVEETLKEHTAILSFLRARVETLHGMVERLIVRVERFEQEYEMIKVALNRLEDKFDRFEAHRLEERITALENRVTALETIRDN